MFGLFTDPDEEQAYYAWVRDHAQKLFGHGEENEMPTVVAYRRQIDEEVQGNEP